MKKGPTLIEVLVVIALLGILVLMLIPAKNHHNDNSASNAKLSYVIEEIEPEAVYAVTGSFSKFWDDGSINTKNLTGGLKELAKRYKIKHISPITSSYRYSNPTKTLVVFVERK